MCLVFSTVLFETSLILRKIQRDFVINLSKSLHAIPLFLSYFNKTRILKTDFRTNHKYPVFWNVSRRKKKGQTGSWQKNRYIDRHTETEREIHRDNSQTHSNSNRYDGAAQPRKRSLILKSHKSALANIESCVGKVCNISVKV